MIGWEIVSSRTLSIQNLFKNLKVMKGRLAAEYLTTGYQRMVDVQDPYL